MDKKKFRQKSKTPIKGYSNYLGEESKYLPGELSNLGNSSDKTTKDTALATGTDKNVFTILDWGSIDQNTLAFLKRENESKQKIMDEMILTQESLRETINTLKAQNSTLHKELNNCRSKNYELDVELYLVKENLTQKTKDCEKLNEELEGCKNNEKNWGSLKEENEALLKEIAKNKYAFEAKIKKSLQKNEELIKIINENNECIADLKQKFVSFTNDPDDFLIRRNTSVEHKLRFDKLKIPRNYQSSLSPERFFNYTDRSVKPQNSILSDLMMLLRVETAEQMLSAVIHLKERQKDDKKYKKFCKQAQDIVVECSPAGYFKSRPSLRQVWKWITRLLEEYMKLKQVL